jgi:hypothetical protein
MSTPDWLTQLAPSDNDNESKLRRVAVEMCQNCIDAVPGQCHVPGCLFCRWSTDDIGPLLTHMRYMVTYLDGEGDPHADE